MSPSRLGSMRKLSRTIRCRAAQLVELQLRALRDELPLMPQPPTIDALRIVLPPALPIVPDTYAHSLWRDTAADQYFVVESGGIAGTARWFGPVHALHPALVDLVNERTAGSTELGGVIARFDR